MFNKVLSKKIITRAKEGLEHNILSSASSAISLYTRLREKNKKFPYISPYSERHDTILDSASKKRILSDDGQDKLKQIIDFLESYYSGTFFTLKIHFWSTIFCILATVTTFLYYNSYYDANDIRIAKYIVALIDQNDSVSFDLDHATGAFKNYKDIYKKYDELPKLPFSNLRDGYEVVCNKSDECSFSRDTKGELIRMYGSVKAFVETAEDRIKFAYILIPIYTKASLIDWIYLIFKILSDLGIISVLVRWVHSRINHSNKKD